MELSLESIAGQLSNFRPKTGSMEAWNAAYVRVEDYLRAHRIHNRLHQSRIIEKILERAARRHAQHPALEPTTIAAEETEAMIDAWFGEVFGQRGQPHDRIAIDGRLALLLSDGPQKWPYAFLDDDHIPDDFAQAMQSSFMQAGPDLAVSSMVPRSIEFGAISEVAGETLERIEKWPLLRALFLWVLFLTALGLIFRATR
ncbi:MAG TPA: hypothetical protein VK785_09930 [Opitutaceae bacterium]|jgi:hypothetical protein|nr:hypothetical protein [Opitutaceae bacterium]